MLKIDTKTTHHINYSDLERFVSETYGLKDYSFVDVQECDNDTSHEFSVPSKYADPQRVEGVRAGTVRSNWDLLELLHKDGHIPAGNYVVRVSW